MPFKNRHPLYSCWHSMINRCEQPKTKQFDSYGGRGITVCNRWSIRGGEGFRNFVSDMGERPEGYTLDRINNDLGYSPENCKWSSRSEQQLNRRNTKFVVIDGKQYKSAELAKTIGVKPDTIIERANQGLSLGEVLNKQKRVYKEGLALGGKANGARQKAKTHCPKGHEYNEANTSLSKEGYRRCKKCHAIKEANKRMLLKNLIQ